MLRKFLKYIFTKFYSRISLKKSFLFLFKTLVKKSIDDESTRSLLSSIHESVHEIGTNRARLSASLRLRTLPAHSIRISQVERARTLSSRVSTLALLLPHRSLLLSAHRRSQLVLSSLDHQMGQLLGLVFFSRSSRRSTPTAARTLVLHRTLVGVHHVDVRQLVVVVVHNQLRVVVRIG